MCPRWLCFCYDDSQSPSSQSFLFSVRTETSLSNKSLQSGDRGQGPKDARLMSTWVCVLAGCGATFITQGKRLLNGRKRLVQWWNKTEHTPHTGKIKTLPQWSRTNVASRMGCDCPLLHSNGTSVLLTL